MAFNPHEDEPRAAAPTTAQTKAVLSELSTEELASLSVALEGLSSSISQSINSESDLLADLPDNKQTIGQLFSDVEDTKAEDLPDSIAAINSALADIVTTDTKKLQDAMFSSSMIDHVAALIQSRLSALAQAQAVVNGFKQAVDGVT
jgi:hypothetical protein